VGAARLVLVDLEDLADVAPAPVDLERPLALERQAVLMDPLVRYLDRFTPRRISHALSTVTVFVVIVLAIAGVGILVGPAIALKGS